MRGRRDGLLADRLNLSIAEDVACFLRDGGNGCNWWAAADRVRAPVSNAWIDRTREESTVQAAAMKLQPFKETITTTPTGQRSEGPAGHRVPPRSRVPQELHSLRLFENRSSAAGHSRDGNVGVSAGTVDTIGWGVAVRQTVVGFPPCTMRHDKRSGLR
jgi:hypothetical protein